MRLIFSNSQQTKSVKKSMKILFEIFFFKSFFLSFFQEKYNKIDKDSLSYQLAKISGIQNFSKIKKFLASCLRFFF